MNQISKNFYPSVVSVYRSSLDNKKLNPNLTGLAHNHASQLKNTRYADNLKKTVDQQGVNWLIPEVDQSGATQKHLRKWLKVLTHVTQNSRINVRIESRSAIRNGFRMVGLV